MDVATGTILPVRIPDTQFRAAVHWHPDGSSFFCNPLTGKVGTPERYLDSRVRHHRLGTDPAADRIVMARGFDHAVAYEYKQLPAIVTSPKSKHAVLGLRSVRQQRWTSSATRAQTSTDGIRR